MFNFTKEMVPDLERYLLLYYHKIVHLDLADDSYEIILMQDGETQPSSDNIREWMDNFILSYVHPEDQELFRQETARKRFFDALEGESIDFEFRRKVGRDDYATYRFIFIPDGHSETTGYVFIKYVI